ncbi:MAG: metallophosphoesterase [Bacilli bacterium]|nr:metallophosphoesterase [Bacilli bacterium]
MKRLLPGECVALDFNLEGTTLGYSGIKPAYKCGVNLTGLTPSTDYRYRVGKNNMTASSFFRTAGDESFTFLVISDSQLYGSTATDQNYRNTLVNAFQKAEDNNTPISLILNAGDIVNDGGKLENYAIIMNADTLRYAPLAMAIGNHDILDAAGGYAGSRFFNSMHNNPTNGATGSLGTSYYFKYGTSYFFVIDTTIKSTSAYQRQIDWFVNIMETEQPQYVFVMGHFPNYGDDGSLVNSMWVPVLNDYNIDFYFTGHGHTLQQRQLKNYISIEAGSTYNPENRYVLVTVTPSMVRYKAYTGDTVSFMGSSAAKRGAEIASTFSKEEYMNKLSISSIPSNRTKAEVKWDKSGYGYVNYITVTNEANKVILTKRATSDIDLVATISGLTVDKEYTYKFKVDFKDGTSAETMVSFNTFPSYGAYENISYLETEENYVINLDSSTIEASLLSEIRVYLNDTLQTTITPTAKFFKLSKALFGDNNKIDLYGYSTAESKEVLLGTLSINKEVVKPVMEVNTTSVELEEGKTTTITSTITAGFEDKVKWQTSDDKVATVINGVITAVGEGTATITVSVEGFDDLAIEIIVQVKAKEVIPDPEPEPEPDPEPEPEPEPTPEETTGCASSSTVVMLGGLILVRLITRKRKYFI